VCVAIRDSEPERFERAALRWLARFCVERRDATDADVRLAAGAFESMAGDPAAALKTLRRLCR
jgi:ribosomal protein S7